MFSEALLLFANSLLFSLRLSGGGSFPKPLTAEEERECLKRFAEGDAEARNLLVERNLRLVAHIIKKYYTQNGDQEDLISIGTIGLIKAISSFDPEKGARLATYAARCIENAILPQRPRNEASAYAPDQTCLLRMCFASADVSPRVRWVGAGYTSKRPPCGIRPPGGAAPPDLAERGTVDNGLQAVSGLMPRRRKTRRSGKRWARHILSACPAQSEKTEAVVNRKKRGQPILIRYEEPFSGKTKFFSYKYETSESFLSLWN